MNINKIFSLFKSPEEPEETISQIDLSESPVVWIGMFKRLITNYETFAKQLIKFLGDTNPDLDVVEIERISGYMVYDKAYNHLFKLDIINQTHLDCIHLYSDDIFKKTLDAALIYFESVEEYERCIFLKQIQDIVNLSQK
jgi:hypothetical protein